EWRTFANDEGGDDPSRVGAASNPLLNGNQLETMISGQDGGSGRARELAKAQSRSAQNKNDRNLLSAYKDIGSMGDAIGLTKIVCDTARQIYKKVDDNKALKGKSHESIIAACIFIACRQCHVPRTFKEICALTRVPKKEIGRVFKTLEKMLNDEPVPQSSNELQYQSSGSTNAQDLMVRFCNRLGLPPFIQAWSADLVKSAADLGTLAGRSPISIAAAGIFFVSAMCKVPKTGKDIAEVAGVSDGTIRNAYKLLYQDREKLVKQEWLANGRGNLVSRLILLY
ncbi:Transcription initiation factor IIB, partial [Neolecta irregularis DAH-3]